jgi:hypothetical protein
MHLQNRPSNDLAYQVAWMVRPAALCQGLNVTLSKAVVSQTIQRYAEKPFT